MAAGARERSVPQRGRVRRRAHHATNAARGPPGNLSPKAWGGEREFGKQRPAVHNHCPQATLAAAQR